MNLQPILLNAQQCSTLGKLTPNPSIRYRNCVNAIPRAPWSPVRYAGLAFGIEVAVTPSNSSPTLANITGKGSPTDISKSVILELDWSRVTVIIPEFGEALVMLVMSMPWNALVYGWPVAIWVVFPSIGTWTFCLCLLIADFEMLNPFHVARWWR